MPFTSSRNGAATRARRCCRCRRRCAPTRRRSGSRRLRGAPAASGIWPMVISAPHSAVRGSSGMPVPVIFGVRVGAERDQPSRDREQRRPSAAVRHGAGTCGTHKAAAPIVAAHRARWRDPAVRASAPRPARRRRAPARPAASRLQRPGAAPATAGRGRPRRRWRRARTRRPRPSNVNVRASTSSRRAFQDGNPCSRAITDCASCSASSLASIVRQACSTAPGESRSARARTVSPACARRGAAIWPASSVVRDSGDSGNCLGGIQPPC